RPLSDCRPAANLTLVPFPHTVAIVLAVSTTQTKQGNPMRTIALAVLAGGILAACSSWTAGPKVVHFTCDDNSEITVEFGVDAATVRREDGKAFVLPQRMS